MLRSLAQTLKDSVDVLTLLWWTVVTVILCVFVLTFGLGYALGWYIHHPRELDVQRFIKELDEEFSREPFKSL